MYDVMLFHVMLSIVALRHVKWYVILFALRHVMLCYGMLYIQLCFVKLGYVMSCYDLLCTVR